MPSTGNPALQPGLLPTKEAPAAAQEARQGKDAGGEGPAKGCRARQAWHRVCAALPPHRTFAGCRGEKRGVRAAPRSRRAVEANRRNRREKPATRRRVPDAAGSRGRGRNGQLAGDRNRVSGDDGPHDVGPLSARPGAAVAVERLSDVVAAHGPAVSRRRRRADDRTVRRRPAVPRRGVDRQHALRLHQAELSFDGAVDAEHGSRRRGNRRAHRPQGRFLYAPVRRRARAVEFPDDQSRSLAGDDREQAARTCSTG